MNNFKMCTILLFFTLTSIISFANANYNTSISYNNTLIRNKRGFGGIKLDYDPHDLTGMKNTLAAALYVVMCANNYLLHQVKEDKFCVINVKVLKIEHALIIDPKDHSKFLYPDDKGNIYFKEGDPVFLSCAHEEINYFNLLPGKSYQTFVCVCGLTFSNGYRLFNFNELTCNTHPKYSLKLMEDESRHQNFYVGFYTRPNDFLSLYEVKYWKDRQLAGQVKYTVSKSLLGGQSTNVKVPLPPGVCCKIIPSILQALNEDAQIQSFKELLPYQSHEHRAYFRKDGCRIFGRGRLASRDANVYSAAALAMYHYTNIMPMFKCITGNNWLKIDNHINEMATTLKKDLTVYAGVGNTLALFDHMSRTFKYIYLSVSQLTSGRRKKSFPVPLYFFKMVIDLSERKGVVYVTVNNLIDDPSAASKICKNHIFKMSGVKMPRGWQPKNHTAGYSYMCTVNDFQTSNNLSFVDNIKDELLYIPGEEDEQTEIESYTPAEETTTTKTESYTPAEETTTTKTESYTPAKETTTTDRYWVIRNEFKLRNDDIFV